MKLEVPENFDDVSIAFSKEEWKMLSKHEKALHREVMVQNYETMVSLGYVIPKEQLLLLFTEVKEEPEEHQNYSEDNTGICRSIDFRLNVEGQLSFKCRPTSTVGRPYVCMECGKSFRHLYILKVHRDIHFRGTEHVCSDCGKAFSQWNSLRKHQRHHTNGSSSHSSTTKQVPVVSLTSSSHVILHNERLYKCHKCEKSFLQLRGLKVHQKTHAPDRKCGEQVAFMKCMKADPEKELNIMTEYEWGFLDGGTGKQILQSGKDIKPFKCNVCTKSFHKVHHLQSHQIAHVSKKPYKCSECQKSFSQAGCLTMHLRAHQRKKLDSSLGGKRFKCDVCNKSYVAQCGLKQHQRIHTGEKPFECNKCKKTFFTSSNFIVHTRLHTGERPYICRWCKKTFSQHSHLTVHLRTHTGERPYKCGTCKKTFTQKCHLRTHSIIHTGSKPHKCGICKKGFNYSSYLKVHQRIHTGEKPFECKMCLTKFTHPSSLKKHQLKHSGKKPYQCSKCKKGFNKPECLVSHQCGHVVKKR
ncbi:zinc finger protein OZF-like isoform X2 [Protopterus annectens]|uniref:zinc finger protein OZF-like isoform X2 n=1 Tax=Protopterus annectens TaxID=7888 RepID=UPI001CFAF885|nr:zinc finger protein OZF-like isoform X2 [Protopterus annectens]